MGVGVDARYTGNVSTSANGGICPSCSWTVGSRLGVFTGVCKAKGGCNGRTFSFPAEWQSQAVGVGDANGFGEEKQLSSGIFIGRGKGELVHASSAFAANSWRRGGGVSARIMAAMSACGRDRVCNRV
mmetsp:Transcript_104510/g.278070  ORF Transcript_104510/g.278070 Transcript_104510/m.278070 type:complete len:128 (+) Transcript_104510:250-633(+)